jgi:hypothetical protein
MNHMDKKPPGGNPGGDAGGGENDQYTAHDITTHAVVQAMVARGDMPVPCRGKKPYHGGWQHRSFGPPDFAPTDNVGLRTGEIIAIDIDVSDEAKAAEFEKITRQSLGDSPVRVGRWPRRCLFYRLKAPMAKQVISSPHGKVEVLGLGQQVVVHGLHPSGAPYKWRGHPLWSPQCVLATVDAESVTEFLQAVRVAHGVAEKEKPSSSEQVVAPLPADRQQHDTETRAQDVERALAAYWDADSYDDWTDAALALASYPQGRALWLAWSATSSKHVDAVAAAKWQETSSSARGEINVASIMEKVPADVRQAWGKEHAAQKHRDPIAEAHGAKVAASILPSRRGPPEGDDADEGHEHHEADEAAHGPPLSRGEASCPEHLLAVPGVLQDVVRYYNLTAARAQPAYAVAAALALGGVILGQRWKTTRNNYGSHFALLVSATATGKEHVKTVIEAMLDAAQLGHLLGPAGYTSASGVFSALISRPAHIAVIDELGRTLKSAANRNMQHKADSLTAIMECFGRQDGVLRPTGYATIGLSKEQADAFEKVIRRPSLTLLGMSTSSSLEQALTSDDVASGFLNRFIVVRGDDELKVPTPPENVDAPSSFIAWARDHAAAQGGDSLVTAGCGPDLPPKPVEVPFTPEAQRVFKTFGEQLVAMQRRSTTARSLLGRVGEVAMRLSLIVARSMQQDEVSGEAAQWACQYVEHHAMAFLEVAGAMTADTEFERRVLAVVDQVRRAGTRGCTMRDLATNCRPWSSMKPHERDAVLTVAQQDHGLRMGKRVNKAGPSPPCYFLP